VGTALWTALLFQNQEKCERILMRKGWKKAIYGDRRKMEGI